MSIPAARRRRSSARSLGGRARRACCSPPRRASHGRRPERRGLSRHHLIRACEASLKRLRTDCIDLYQVHEWDGQTPLEETLEALDDLVRRARCATSAAPTSPAGTHEGAGRLRARTAGRASSASRSTTRCRPARPNTSWCRSRSTRASGMLVWSPLAGGLLSRQVPPRRAGPAGARQLPAGASRRSATRRGSMTSSTCWSRSAKARGVSRRAGGAGLAARAGRP